MRNLLYHSLAPNTRAAYKSGTNAFIEFCLQYCRFTPHHSILPATEETLMLFASYLSLKVSPPTIKVYLAAVRNLHMEAGFPHLFDNLMLLPRLIRGIKRLYSHERRPRLPITPHILLRFKQHINLNWHDHHLLWSAMIVAFFGFLRSSELLALCKEDILILDKNTSPPTFGLHIRSSKTDPFRHTTVIRLPPTGDEALCPARAVSYLINQPNLSGPHSPLLQWSSGAAMTRQSLNNSIKLLAHHSGLNETQFSTHSFRIGAATTASAAGVPDCLIRTLGRWSSDAYQGYIRTPVSTLDKVATSLATYRP